MMREKWQGSNAYILIDRSRLAYGRYQLDDDVDAHLPPQHFLELLTFFPPDGPGGFDGSCAVTPGVRALSMFFIWKTTLNAVWNTLLSPFFSLAEHSTNPWKAYFLAACSISSLETHSRSFASSPLRSSSSLRSSFVPTKMHGQALAVVLTSDIHFLHAFSSEFLYMRLKHTMKQSVLA